MQLLGETLLSRYNIEKVLGSGGFGDTYLAKDIALPNTPRCVVKHLKPKTETPEVQAIAQSLFEREAHMLYELGEHDSIPRLFAHFEQQGEFFLVQEFIEGHDLSTEIQPGVAWSTTRVKSLLQELLSILSILHQQNVIHRDIKPQNIMRRQKDGKLFLIDFGAVKEIPQLTVTETGATALTVAIGSPGYMPSEQAVGKPKAASDIYAVGMIAIEALTGQNPTLLPTDPNTGDRIWPIPSDVPPDFEAFLKRMTQDHFSQRYKDAIEALTALEHLGTGVESTLIQPPTPENLAPPVPPTQYQQPRHQQPRHQQPVSTEPTQSQKNWLPWALSGGGLIALGAGLVMVLQPWKTSVQITSKVDSTEPNQSSVDFQVKRTPDPSPPTDPSSPVETPPSEWETGETEAPAPQPSQNSSSAQQQAFEPVGYAVVIDPPSNIRRSPNGEILCAVPSSQSIAIANSQGDWYPTDFCGESGLIHISQLSFNVRQALVIDPPSNVRSQPNGSIICAVPERIQIEVYDPVGDWYRTHVCQTSAIGYIHSSQIQLE